MPSDDLRSIPDLHDKHRRVLAGELKITTFRGLVDADRRDIYRAMRDSPAASHPRADRAVAGRRPEQAERGQRRTGRTGTRPRRSPSSSRSVRSTRRGAQDRGRADRGRARGGTPDLAGLGLRGDLRVDARAGPRRRRAGEGGVRNRGQRGAAAARVTEPAAAPAPAAEVRERPQLRISKITVIGPVATAGAEAAGVAVTAGSAAGGATADRDRPGGAAAIEISVSGARPDQEIHAVARVFHPGGFEWNMPGPVVIRGAGVVSFGLSGLPVGPAAPDPGRLGAGRHGRAGAGGNT